MRWLILMFILVLSACSGPHVEVPGDREPFPDERLTDWVDPLRGPDAFPGALVPFGMLQPGPDSCDRGRDCSNGYRVEDATLFGFSHTRLLGGSTPVGGDVLLLPVVNADGWDDAKLTDLKADEIAAPGYYAVSLTGQDVRAEITADAHVAMHRYTFPDAGPMQLVVDLSHQLSLRGRDTVVMTQSEVRESGLTARIDHRGDIPRIVHAAISFDQPIIGHEKVRVGRAGERYLLSFQSGDSRVLSVKLALSTVDAEGAAGNLATLEGWDFWAVRLAAADAWEGYLSRVRIKADDAVKSRFYTALYRGLSQQANIADGDGRVRGPAGKSFEASDGMYLSGLVPDDAALSRFALLRLVAPEMASQMVRSLMRHEARAGTLPVATFWGREVGGETAVSGAVIADALASDLPNFSRDAAAALAGPGEGRRGEAARWGAAVLEDAATAHRLVVREMEEPEGGGTIGPDYVFAMMGLYPAAGEGGYIAGRPLAEEVLIDNGTDPSLLIRRHDTFLRHSYFNKWRIHRTKAHQPANPFVSHQLLTRGGELRLSGPHEFTGEIE